jgi:hypothetical protein
VSGDEVGRGWEGLADEAAALRASRVVRVPERRGVGACCIAVRLQGVAAFGRRSARIHTFRRAG